MSRNLRFLFAVVLIGGALAYRYFREDPSRPHPAVATHATAAKPVPKRMLGSLAFTPCTLALHPACFPCLDGLSFG